MRRLAVLVLAAGLLACSEPQRPPGLQSSVRLSSTRRAAPLPVARTEVAGAAWDGQVVVVGGYLADGDTSAQVDLYDPATDTWSRLPDMPAGRNHAGAAVLDGRLYVAGGFSKTAKDDVVWSLGHGEKKWRVEPPLRHGRAAHAMVFTHLGLVVFGGVHGSALVAETEVLKPGATAWAELEPMWLPREHLAGVGISSQVLAIGGRVGSPAGNLTEVHRYTGERWERVPHLVTARGGIAAALVDGRPCVAGGERPEHTIPGIECWTGLDGNWIEVARLDVARHGLAVVGIGNTLHVIGGGARPGLYVSDVHEVFEFRVDGGRD